MKTFIPIIIVAFFLIGISQETYAQQGTRFNSNVIHMGPTEYKIELSINNPQNVQFIDIYFMEGQHELGSYTASLNKKRDGLYYLFFNNQENRVSLDYMELDIKLEDFGLLKKPGFKIVLTDKNFRVVDQNYQPIN